MSSSRRLPPFPIPEVRSGAVQFELPAPWRRRNVTTAAAVQIVQFMTPAPLEQDVVRYKHLLIDHMAFHVDLGTTDLQRFFVDMVAPFSADVLPIWHGEPIELVQLGGLAPGTQPAGFVYKGGRVLVPELWTVRLTCNFTAAGAHTVTSGISGMYIPTDQFSYIP